MMEVPIMKKPEQEQENQFFWFLCDRDQHHERFNYLCRETGS